LILFDEIIGKGSEQSLTRQSLPCSNRESNLRCVYKVASGMIRLNCQFKGRISSTGAVIVADRGDIEADIETMQIGIAGKVKGNIRATNQLEITKQRILLGDAETPSLKLDPGAFFSGHCDMPAHRFEKPAPNVSEHNSRPHRP